MLASPKRTRVAGRARCRSLNSKACTPACRSRKNCAQRSISGSSALSRYAAVSISVSKSQRSRKRSRGTNALRGAACRASAISRSSTAAGLKRRAMPARGRAQQFTYPGHAHGAQGVQPLGIPGCTSNGQLRQPTRQQAGIFDEYPLAGAGEPQRRQSRWCRRAVGTQLQPTPSGIDVGMQRLERTEQLHAAFDLQQQGVWHFNTDQRGELLRMQAEALQHSG